MASQQSTVTSHKAQDLTHKVNKQVMQYHQVLEPHSRIVPVCDLCADEHAQVEPVSPIKLKLFKKWIRGFIFQGYLLTGLRFGFRIGYEDPRYFRSSPNLKSCRDFPEIMSEKITTERNLGRIQGPFNIPPFPNIQVSAIGVMPKKRPGEFRSIHHLSFP